MKKTIIKPLRFTVVGTGKENFESGNQHKAQDKVVEFQREGVALIVIHDSRSKKAIQYKKGPNEKNYRISAGEYVENEKV